MMGTMNQLIANGQQQRSRQITQGTYMAELKDWAAFYLSQGLPVFPIKNKVPCVEWARYQSELPTEQDIEKWWNQFSDAGIALVTGPISNRLVLDCDGPEGEDSLKEYFLPSTLVVKTRRGWQWHFLWPKGFTGKTTLAGILPGVDVRGDKGICVLPPSLYKDGSGRYTWQSGLDTPLAECPQWLIDLLIEKNKPREINKEAGESWLKEKLDAIAPGNRNATFTSIAGSLRSRGYSSSDIFELLSDKAIRVGLQLSELKGLCESVGGYSPKTQIDSDAQSISDFLKDEQKVEWLVPGIVSKGCIGFIAGLQETGKTWMLIDLAVEMARGGGHWLGKFPTKGAKVLFVDQERHKSETQRRLKNIITASGLQPGLLNNSLSIKSGTSTRLNLPQSFEAFRRELAEIKPDVVMVDSFATFHTVAENDRTEIQKVLELIKSLRNEFGCSFLFINHEGKSVLHNEPGVHKEPHSADMMGSVAVPAAAELVLTVRRKDNESCMVYHTKSTMGPKVEPFSVSVIDVENGIRVEGR